jgi:acetyl-CoA synthetase
MVRDTTVLLDERRVFEPSEEIKKRALIKNWDEAIEKGKDIEKYWSDNAEQFEWFQKWDKVLDDSNKPFYKWFVNGKINLAYNAVDRWIETEKRNQVAIIYLNERGEEKKITFYELYIQVNKLANALINLGVKKGDTVSTYMPMCPELLIALLACTKIGAVHSVSYSGLSVGAFVERINDAKAKVLFTADGTYRRGKVINLKSIADEAILQCPTVETIVVVNHTGTPMKYQNYQEEKSSMTDWWKVNQHTANQNPWIQRIPLSSYTHLEAQENPKVWCTPQQDTWWELQPQPASYLTSTTTTCGGVLEILDG